jgi:glycolate oxidase
MDSTASAAPPDASDTDTPASSPSGGGSAGSSATQALLDAIRTELPGVRLLTDMTDRESYRTDETPYLHPGLPIGVALPGNTAEVSALVKLAAKYRVPIVPRGAGTGLSGGAAGVDGALTVALTRMDRILEIDHENMCVVVQPGVINAALKKAVAAEGLFYGPDPASYEMCSIGGNLGTNAGGLCCVKYGQTRDWVLGLEVVLADGAVIRTGGKNVKDVAGYSMTQLFVGSQGTLGLITEATLRLRPAPAARSTLLAFFPTLESAGQAVSGMTAAGMQPCTLELLDQFTIAAVDDMHHLGLDREAAAMLLIESDLPSPESETELDRAVFACEHAGATLLVRAADAAEGDLLRQARRLAYQALERIGTVKMEDIGVPRNRVPDMLVVIEEICRRHNVRCGTFGHAGDGNLHPNLIFERDDPRAEEITEAVRTEFYKAALEFGGTLTAEHGIGLARREFLVQQRGPEAVGAMRAIKNALDPLGILNPGKVFMPLDEPSVRA